MKVIAGVCVGTYPVCTPRKAERPGFLQFEPHDAGNLWKIAMVTNIRNIANGLDWVEAIRSD